MPVEIKAWFTERGRVLDQCVVATLIIAAGAGSWDDLFARALWLPTTLLALISFRLMDDLRIRGIRSHQKPVPVHATLTNLAPLRHALGVLALLTLLSTLVFRDWLVSGALGLILLSYHIGYTVFPRAVLVSASALGRPPQIPRACFDPRIANVSRRRCRRSGRFRHLWTL